MTNLAKIALSALIATVAISGSAPAYAGIFTGTITSERERVIDHRDNTGRRNEVVLARRGVDPAAVVMVGTPPTGPVTPPSNGGINPIGDVSCFDGQVILFQDNFDVYYSDCSKYIYNFRAIAENVIVDIYMESFGGTYNTKIIGFAD